MNAKQIGGSKSTKSFRENKLGSQNVNNREKNEGNFFLHVIYFYTNFRSQSVCLTSSIFYIDCSLYLEIYVKQWKEIPFETKRNSKEVLRSKIERIDDNRGAVIAIR